MINGNTLCINIDAGNLGHSFNDWQHQAYAYFLKNENTINNIYIDNKLDNTKFEHLFINKKISMDNTLLDLNMSMVLLFFMDTNKKVYFTNKDYIFENIINIETDRFFEKYTNYIDVFNKLRTNYKKYIKVNDLRYNITLLYRTNNNRSIFNIDLFKYKCNLKNLNLNLINLSNTYNFYTIVNAFNSSNNIISIHGCELTYSIFMEENCTILELTHNDHIEPWWNIMKIKFINYGLNYRQKIYNSLNTNLYLSNKYCEEIFKELNINDSSESFFIKIKNDINIYNINNLILKLSYFLKNEISITNIYISIDYNNIELITENYNKKIINTSNDINAIISFIMLFFLNFNKKVYFSNINNNKYDNNNENDNSNCHLSIFDIIYNNYKLNYDTHYEKRDVLILYKSDIPTQLINDLNNIKYTYYCIDICISENIITLFNNVDNVIYLCNSSIPYFIFMNKNTTIIDIYNNYNNYYNIYGINYIVSKYNDIILNIKIKKYDVICSLGTMCDNALSLYSINLRKLSLPFDYIISKLSGINTILFEKKNFNECIDISLKTNNYNNNLFFNFPHHNNDNNDNQDTYHDKLKILFNNKLNNLLSLINENKRILFIHTDKNPINTKDDIYYFIDNMKQIYNYTNFKLIVINSENLQDNKYIFIKYKLDRNKYIGYNGTDYGDIKIRQIITNYMINNYYLSSNINKKINKSEFNFFSNIVSIGSRCLTSSILDKNNLKKVSLPFDSINIKTLNNFINILYSNFKILIDKNNLKLININNENKTSNVYLDDGIDLTFPHFDLNDNNFYEKYLFRIEKFKKIRFLNSLYIFTITDNKHSNDDIIYFGNELNIYIERNYVYSKILIIDLFDNNNLFNYELINSFKNIDIYKLNIHTNSYTGGIFLNNDDNINFINLVKSYCNFDILFNYEDINSLVINNL